MGVVGGGRGGSRISRMGVHLYKGQSLLILSIFFLKYLMKMK